MMNDRGYVKARHRTPKERLKCWLKTKLLCGIVHHYCDWKHVDFKSHGYDAICQRCRQRMIVGPF